MPGGAPRALSADARDGDCVLDAAGATRALGSADDNEQRNTVLGGAPRALPADVQEFDCVLDAAGFPGLTQTIPNEVVFE